MRLHVLIALIACCIAAVVADTEIRNFHLPLPTFDHSPVQNDYREPPRTPWRRTRVAMSSDEELIGVKLDLDEVHKDWTVRASWAGSSPIKLNMTLVPTRSPSTVILFLQSSQLTPHFPHPLLDLVPLPQLLRPRDQGLAVPAGHYETTIDLALEPLIYGVIPESVIPTIYWIISAALASAAVVPLCIRFIEAFAAAPLAPNDAGALSADSASGQTTKAKTKTD